MRLKESTDVHDEDKTLTLELIDHMTAKGIGKLRIVKYVNHVISLSRLVDKPITRLSRGEVEKLVGRINTSGDIKDTTKRDHKVILKKYFQFARKFDEEEKQYPEEVRWIKTGQKRRRLLPETLLSQDEVRLVLARKFAELVSLQPLLSS